MPGTQTKTPIPDLLARAADDPWSLTLAERARVAESIEAKDAQAAWHRRLPDLVEPPAPDQGFPCWLLESPHFAGLRNAVGAAGGRAELPTAVADQLQRFVDLFRDYVTQLDPLASSDE